MGLVTKEKQFAHCGTDSRGWQKRGKGFNSNTGQAGNVFQTKLGFSKVAFYPQNLKKKRNYADKSHFWLKNLIFVEKP